MSYNKIFNHLSVRGRIWILAKSPRMVSLFMGMRFVPIYQFLWKVHMHKTPRLKGIVGVFLHKLGFLHFLEKEGGIPQLDRQIIKVPESEAMNVEEFIVDISKSKIKTWKNSSLIFPNRR